MAEIERIREAFTESPPREYFEEKARDGWHLVAVEWQRPAEERVAEPGQEVPYGFRVGPDCRHLVVEPREQEALTLMLELIVDDRKSLAHVASALNDRGFTTRSGSGWSQKDVFEMLPQLIETAPSILGSREWMGRRGQLSTTGS